MKMILFLIFIIIKENVKEIEYFEISRLPGKYRKY